MKLATSCYITKNNKTLMLHRIKKENDIHEGKWVGLGGKMEAGETPEECIIREVKEECGLTIKNPSLKGIITFPGFKNDEDWYVFLFTTSEFEGNIFDTSDEGELEWINNDEIFSLNLWEGDKLFMDWMLKYKFFSAKFIYKEGKLVDHSLIVY
ncbi:8-oxo-dGTP diphosphatase [Clostridium sp. 19966]|uniref:NUDIX hydrolase n=1 Tax=Clostridium sp. 19966 TaxID=2768166 RepID=UPI0028DD6BA2|nr:8-oxo-dGTP diphosphatase [Clostridium sp. 19966]MDT8718389.1 8-oxo-dGTP diphosphatase [Clostridium sp. 19966]